MPEVAFAYERLRAFTLSVILIHIKFLKNS